MGWEGRGGEGLEGYFWKRGREERRGKERRVFENTDISIYSSFYYI